MGTLCEKIEGPKGPIKQRKRIVQMYTASVHQIGHTLRDKGEKEWKMGKGK